MKNVFLFLLSVVFACTTFAQTDNKSAPKTAKHDIVLKLNGDELTGKITAISDKEVKFVYDGETLEYTIKKSDILKITHSSGRVEFINRPSLPSEKKDPAAPATNPATAAANPATAAAAPQPSATAAPHAAPVDHHNKIGILPFGFLRDGQSAAQEMGYKVQLETYTFMAKHSAGYSILDPRTTNALLIKAGITRDKMMGFTMDEICNVLGVEYLVDGTVTINKGVQSNTSSGSFKASSDNNGKSSDGRDVRAFNSSSSISSQTYITSISMNIFTDKNASIYNESHRAFLASTDASYSATLQYLLKRSPLYRK